MCSTPCGCCLNGTLCGLEYIMGCWHRNNSVAPLRNFPITITEIPQWSINLLLYDCPRKVYFDIGLYFYSLKFQALHLFKAQMNTHHWAALLDVMFLYYDRFYNESTSDKQSYGAINAHTLGTSTRTRSCSTTTVTTVKPPSRPTRAQVLKAEALCDSLCLYIHTVLHTIYCTYR